MTSARHPILSDTNLSAVPNNKIKHITYSKWQATSLNIAIFALLAVNHLSWHSLFISFGSWFEEATMPSIPHKYPYVDRLNVINNSCWC